MKAIHLVAVGAEAAGRREFSTGVPLELLDALAAGLARVFRVSCPVSEEPLDASFAFDAVRNQYYATALLQRLQSPPLLPAEETTRLLGVTGFDLYVPVLTFVFGEAQLVGRCAVVSFHRLREEFYGLPANPDLLRDRLLKEAVHELGHTFGLRHCADWRCVMASNHAVERLDLKTSGFCPACQQQIAGVVPSLRGTLVDSWGKRAHTAIR